MTATKTKVVHVDSRPGHTYTTDINTGRHLIVADEPQSDGGDDLGPTPYELLMAALGSCTVITLEMYANRKKWPLTSTHVTVTHEKVEEIDPVTGNKRLVDEFVQSIRLEGDLTGEQTARLMDIAARCPVHKTLASSPRLIDRLEAK